MAEDTTIQWATHTWSSWIGCSRVHTGCAHCYAEAMAGRLGVTWGPDGTRRRTGAWYWKDPLRWEQNLVMRISLFGAIHGSFIPRWIPISAMFDPISDDRRLKIIDEELRK